MKTLELYSNKAGVLLANVKANITVSMYADRTEIISPSGLLQGMTEEGYLTGSISILRNHIIGNVSHRIYQLHKGLRMSGSDFVESTGFGKTKEDY